MCTGPFLRCGFCGRLSQFDRIQFGIHLAQVVGADFADGQLTSEFAIEFVFDMHLDYFFEA